MIRQEWGVILSCMLISMIISIIFIPSFLLSNSDSFSYIDVAENIAKGKGIIHDSPYIDEEGNVKNMPLIAWLPMYPFLTSILIRFSIEPVLASKLVNLIFACLTIIPVFYLTRNLYGKKTAYIVCIAISVFYPFVLNQINTLTETLYIFFLITSIYFLNLGEKKKDFILAGIFAGLTYLTKGVGLVLMFTVVVYIFLFYKNRIKRIFWVSLGFVTTALPWWIRNFIVVHNPFYYSQVRLINLGVENILSNILAIRNVFFDLLPISLFLIFYILSLKEDRKKFFLLILYPVFHLLFFSTWSLMEQYTRLFSPIYIFLIILGIRGFFNLIEYFKIKTLERIFIFILLIAIITPNLYKINNLYFETKNPNYNFIYRLRDSGGIDYMRKNTEEDDVIMALPTSFFGPEGILHFYTGRPTISSVRYAYLYDIGIGPMKFSVLRFSSENYGSDKFMNGLRKLDVKYIFLFKGNQTEEKIEEFEVVYNEDDAIIYKVI